MNMAGRLRRAEQRTKAHQQAEFDQWLHEMPQDDLLTMQAFVEALFAGQEERALAILPSEEPAWIPKLAAWMEWMRVA
ncbi:MAG: hypothetical protein JWN14_612 [Chthonomonadales bacterium]|nr:hypothetical protein [Chthonomonadales bacterium]